MNVINFINKKIKKFVQIGSGDEYGNYKKLRKFKRTTNFKLCQQQ